MQRGTKKGKNMFEVGRRLRECRELRGLSREQLSEKVYSLVNDGENTISVKQIGYIECGTRTLSPKYLKLLSRALEVREEYLSLEDNYRTGEERFAAVFDGAESSTKVLHSMIELVAQSKGCEIDIIDNSDNKMEIVEISEAELFYAVRRNGVVVAHLSFEQYCHLRDELFDYASYLFEKLLGNQERKLLRPYSIETIGGEKHG